MTNIELGNSPPEHAARGVGSSQAAEISFAGTQHGIFEKLVARRERAVINPDATDPDADAILAEFETRGAPEAWIVQRQRTPWTRRQNIARMAWMLVWRLLFRFSFHNAYAWRRMLLRAFGAKVGRGVRIRPSAWVEIPWHLHLGDYAIIGDGAILYSLGQVNIGRCATVSQYAHLCAGTHDHRQRSFPIVCAPVDIGEECWIAADAFIGPGVRIGDRSVVAARSVVTRSVESDVIVGGHPARFLKPRVFDDPA